MGLLAISYPELSGEDRDWIQSIRRRYDPHLELVDPHFSLVFETVDIAPADFINHIRGIGRYESKISFCVRVAKAVEGVVDDKWYLFLVPDEGYGEIIKLHDRLYTGILAKHLRHDIKFMPHVTIGIFEDAGECKKAADELNQRRIEISGTISILDIITLDDNKLETIERIELG